MGDDDSIGRCLSPAVSGGGDPLPPTLPVHAAMEIDGNVKSFAVGDVGAGAGIAVGGAVQSFRAGNIETNNILVGRDIKTFQALSYEGGNLTAGNIGSITIAKGELGADVAAIDRRRRLARCA